MKKLLITLLVLGIASSAHALQLSLTADEHEPTVYISGYLDRDLYVLMVSEGGTLYNFQLGPDAPSCSTGPWKDPIILPDIYPPVDFVDYFVLASCSPDEYPIVDGVYALAHGQVGDIVYAAWFNEVGDFGDIGLVTLIPEPTTIGLLGLGGLFLLRRRRIR
ncbi:MAG: PEP-CTERM sorting domain-containing protein [Planctomycetota bacterium]|jgi:hypothetical protein